MEYREGKICIDIISDINSKNYSDSIIDISNLLDYLLEKNPDLTKEAIKRIAFLLVENGLNNSEDLEAKEYSLIDSPEELRKMGFSDTADLLEIADKFKRLTLITYKKEFKSMIAK